MPPKNKIVLRRSEEKTEPPVVDPVVAPAIDPMVVRTETLVSRTDPTLKVPVPVFSIKPFAQEATEYWELPTKEVVLVGANGSARFEDTPIGVLIATSNGKKFRKLDCTRLTS